MYDNYKEQILSFYHSKKRMPTYAEIAALVGFKSKNAVSKLVSKMVEAGIVGKDHLGRLVPMSSLNELPLLGSVKAGFPALAEENRTDTVSLDDFLVEKKGSTYMLEVDGDSMIDAHIADGDMVLAERTNRAKDGEIVVAEVDGEWTMKYFRQKGDKVWLEPANKKFKNIYPTEELRIAAVVKAVIRKY
jgi:SOS regulatory protein LexA